MSNAPTKGVKVAFINPSRCDKNPGCPAKRMCPQNAISQKKDNSSFFGFGSLSVDKDKCTGCGLCLRYCPHAAISMAAR